MIDLKKYIQLSYQTIDEMIDHAKREFPNESCGYVVENKYIPCINNADEKEDTFVLEEMDFYKHLASKKVQWIIHSHNNNEHASKVDMKKQRDLEVPFIIINLKYGEFSDLFFFGSNIKVPLVGRPFHFGAFDCFTIVKDFYKQNYNYKTPDPPRDFNFDRKREMVFEQYLEEYKDRFDIIKPEEVEEGDILFYRWANQICHAAIYINEQKILHHWVNQLSNYFPLDYKKKHLFFAVKIRR